MDSTKPTADEVAEDHSPRLKIYKDGRVERLVCTDVVPPSFDPKTNVDSKDALFSSENALSARIYIPRITNNQNHKLPLVVYFHGGAFVIASPFFPLYHNYLNALVSEANVIAVSVDYRRAPENPVPCAHEDSWAAIKWVASHANGEGPEDWLNNYADFQRVYFAGDSAGANIVHHMGMRLGRETLDRFNVLGIVLFHPYFWGTVPVDNETMGVNERAYFERLWRLACPNTSGCDDPWINPFVGPSLGCGRVLVFVADKDGLCARGWSYYKKLKESGWRGQIEIVESKGEGHVFHLYNPNCENAASMLKITAAFFNQDQA